MRFSRYVLLKEKYEVVFAEIFETFYDKGYFGDTDKEDIKQIQYEWFCRLVDTIENNDKDSLVPLVANHNNKLTREYYTNLTGNNVRNRKKSEVEKIIRNS
jgi:hypothetical protein